MNYPLVVKLDQIRPNPHQPRKIFSSEELEELAQSIRSVGLIHPPLVRSLANGDYELISGERRLQASKLIGLQEIPVHLSRATTASSAQMALIENIQRVDLNPLEIAEGLKQLQEEFHLNQEELSQKIGKKRSTIANYLRLLTLPESIKESLWKNHISMGHAKAILSLENAAKQNLLHELILRDSLSVREAEAAALRLEEKAKQQALVYRERDFFLEQLGEKLQHAIGTKVYIQGRGKKGSITINYYSLDDLDRILSLFNIPTD